jgi:hypothetical protein
LTAASIFQTDPPPTEQMIRCNRRITVFFRCGRLAMGIHHGSRKDDFDKGCQQGLQSPAGRSYQRFDEIDRGIGTQPEAREGPRQAEEIGSGCACGIAAD